MTRRKTALFGSVSVLDLSNPANRLNRKSLLSIQIIAQCTRTSSGRPYACDGSDKETGVNQFHLSGRSRLDDAKEDVLDRFGNRATSATADWHSIDGANRCDFGSRTGEEYLFGQIEHLARDRHLIDGIAQILGDGAGAITGDAAKDAVAQRRRIDFSLCESGRCFLHCPR